MDPENRQLVADILEANKGLILKPAGGNEDLIQEGYIGLMDAVRSYDINRGTTFSTWAMWHIRKHIHGYIDDHSKTIRVPRYVKLLRKRINTAEMRLRETLGRQPTEQEIGQETGISRLQLRNIMRSMKANTVSMSGGHNDGDPLAAIISDGRPGVEMQDMRAQTLAIVTQAVDALKNRRAAQIIKLRYGLGGVEPMTLREIGKTLGITRERVRQIQEEALEELAEHMEIKGVGPDDPALEMLGTPLDIIDKDAASAA